MKKLISISIIALATLSLAQGLELNRAIVKSISRVFTVSGQSQKNRLEELWNLVDRPAKTNATMVRVEIYRTVNPGVSTNYTVIAVDKIRVKLVED